MSNNKPQIDYVLTEEDLEGYDWGEILSEAKQCISEGENIEIQGQVFTYEQVCEEADSMGV